MDSKKKERTQDLNSESGLVLVLLAIMALVLLLIAGLALGIGFLSSDRSRLQTVANLAAMEALKTYIDNPVGSSAAIASEHDRRELALNRMELILEQNQLGGTRSHLGGVTLQGAGELGGVLRFGTYYRTIDEDRADDGAVSCDTDKYPCFVGVPETADPATTPPANAVLLDLKTEPSNPFLNPVSNIIGRAQLQLGTRSAYTIVNTCAIHLLDVSVSTVGSTHRGHSQNSICTVGTSCPGTINFATDAAVKVQNPSYTDPTDLKLYSTAALFAFDATKIFSSTVPFNPRSISRKNCLDEASLRSSGGNFPDLLYWCNLPERRDDWDPAAHGGAAPPPGMVFRSDYQLEQVFTLEDAVAATTSPRWMLVHKDSSRRPQPLTGFMLGANMALRVLDNLPALANLGAFRAFTGDVFGRSVPPEPDRGVGNPKDALTSNLEYLTQLTNVDFIGSNDGLGGRAEPERHPNLVDAGFFPMDPPAVSDPNPVYAASNIVKAVYDAAVDLSRACASSDRKMIFLYTDGISTCRFSPTDPTFPDPTDTTCAINPPDNSPWINYSFSEYIILRRLIQYLGERGVAVNIIFSGQGVRPHFMNVSDQTDCGSSSKDRDPNCYYDFSTAQRNDFGGQSPPPDPGHLDDCSRSGSWLYDCRSGTVDNSGNLSALSDEDAFNRLLAGEEGIVFGRAVGLMGEMANKTGGVFCPIMPPDPTPGAYYDHDGDCPSGYAGGEAACCRAIAQGSDPSLAGRTPCKLFNHLRQYGRPQIYATEYLNEELQPAACAQRAITQNPYVAIEPFEVVPR